MATRIKGNAHLSPARISRAYLQMMEVAQTAAPHFYLEKFLQFYHSRGYARTTSSPLIDNEEGLSRELGYQVSSQQLEIARTLDRFLREHRGRDLEKRTDYYLTTEELDAAKQAGIFNSICLDNVSVEMDRVPELLIRKTQARTRYLNQSKGHKIGINPKPCKRNQKRRVKFRYKPEIPYQNAGNGEMQIELFEDDFMFSKYGLSVVGSGYHECIDDRFLEESQALEKPKYDGKDQPEQTIPKIEWQAVRKWRNAGRTWRAHMRDIRESKGIKERLQGMREHYRTRKIPKKPKHKPQFSCWY